MKQVHKTREQVEQENKELEKAFQVGLQRRFDDAIQKYERNKSNGVEPAGDALYTLSQQKLFSVFLPDGSGEHVAPQVGSHQFWIPRNLNLKVPETIYNLLRDGGYLDGSEHKTYTPEYRSKVGLPVIAQGEKIN